MAWGVQEDRFERLFSHPLSVTADTSLAARPDDGTFERRRWLEVGFVQGNAAYSSKRPVGSRSTSLAAPEGGA